MVDIGVELIGYVKPKRGPRAFAFTASKKGLSYSDPDDMDTVVDVEDGAFSTEEDLETFSAAVSEYMDENYSFELGHE